MEQKTKYILATVAGTLGSAAVTYAMSRDVKSALVAGVVAGGVTGIASYLYSRGAAVAAPSVEGLRVGLYIPEPQVKKFAPERGPRYYS